MNASKRTRDEYHRWKLSLLRTFVRRHGWESLRRDTIVPPGVRLYSWVHNRRQDYAKGTIADWLARDLEAIPGWMWAPKRERWLAVLESLRSFTRKHGWEALTSEVRVDGVALREWVANRRSEYGRGELDRKSVRALAAIPGWTWEPRQTRQARNLRALRDHVACHGWKDFGQETLSRTGVRIGRWVNHVRVLNRQGLLPHDLAVELEGVPGWTWEPRSSREERYLALLESYVREHGGGALRKHTVVDGERIGAWLLRCRERAKRASLPSKTARKLTSIYPKWRTARSTQRSQR